jgi:hypothetical protein
MMMKKKVMEEVKKEEKQQKQTGRYNTKNCTAETKGGGSKVDLVSDRLIFLLTFY